MCQRKQVLTCLGSWLINTARGAIVVKEDVADALKSGHLRGYGGDVWFPQPAPKDHPLRYAQNPWGGGNAMVPHMSGTSIDAQKVRLAFPWRRHMNLPSYSDTPRAPRPFSTRTSRADTTTGPKISSSSAVTMQPRPTASVRRNRRFSLYDSHECILPHVLLGVGAGYERRPVLEPMNSIETPTSAAYAKRRDRAPYRNSNGYLL